MILNPLEKHVIGRLVKRAEGPSQMEFIYTRLMTLDPKMTPFLTRLGMTVRFDRTRLVRLVSSAQIDRA